MAEFYVRNSLNYEKSVKFNITLRYFVIVGMRGDHKWVLEIGTTYLDINGNSILPQNIHMTSLDNIDSIVEDAVSKMCSVIDWSPLVADRRAPYISSTSPSNGATNVSIYSNVICNIMDVLPSAGIDISDIQVVLNNGTTDFDITNELNITGDPYKYEVTWAPQIRVCDYYD